jgi:hypothetical protein
LRLAPQRPSVRSLAIDRTLAIGSLQPASTARKRDSYCCAIAHFQRATPLIAAERVMYRFQGQVLCWFPTLSCQNRGNVPTPNNSHQGGSAKNGRRIGDTKAICVHLDAPKFVQKDTPAWVPRVRSFGPITSLFFRKNNILSRCDEPCQCKKNLPRRVVGVDTCTIWRHKRAPFRSAQRNGPIFKSKPNCFNPRSLLAAWKGFKETCPGL